MNEIERLNKIRADRGISYELMARDIGVSMQTLRRWITGEFKPSLLGLMMIQKYLDRQKAKSK